MAESFDAVLADLDNAFGMVACDGSIAGAICNEAKRRLAAAHAAEKEAAERDARRLRELLRECQPYVSSMAQASHLTDGFSPKPANEHDRLAERIDACIGGGEGK